LRRPKPSGQLRRGPFTADDVKKALRMDGWIPRAGGNHQSVWEHPEKSPVSEGWSALRAKCPILKGIARTMGISDSELLKLLQ
jgi:hypothetical protein